MRGFTSWGVGRIVFARRVRRACATTVAVVLVGLTSPSFISPASSNAALDGLTDNDCKANETYGGDAVDLALATALKADGYTCTALLNKGQLSKDKFVPVGELWQKKVGSTLKARAIIFGDSNTGLTGAKICLDDDSDPINNVAPGGTEASYCVGSDGAQSVQQGSSGGPTYGVSPLAKVASAAPEEGAGLFELFVDNLVEVTTDPVNVGGYDVNIDGYTEAVLHFNKGSDSIVAYFQPAAATTTTPTTTQDETPTIEVTKTADTPSIAEPGGTVTFTVVIRNTSTTEDVEVTSVTDNPYGAVTCPGGLPTLAPGQSVTCSVSGSVTGGPGTSHTDTVTAEGEDDDGDTATDTDDATVTITDVVPTITVDKSASASVVRTGQQVTYTYVVTTPGPESLTGVTVADDKCSPVAFGSGDTDGDVALDPGESWTYTCTTTLTGDTVNTATATGSDDDGNTVTDTDTASVTVLDPRIALDKSANPTSTTPGGRVTYTYLVTNPGKGELSDIALVDDRCSPVAFVEGDTDGDSRLDTGETWRYTCAVVVGNDVGTLTNVATVTGKDALGGSVSATDTESVILVAGTAFEQQPAAGAVTQQQPAAAAAEAVRAQAVAAGRLPATGSPKVQWLLRTGMGLVVFGALLMAPNRRRRSAHRR